MHVHIVFSVFLLRVFSFFRSLRASSQERWHEIRFTHDVARNEHEIRPTELRHIFSRKRDALLHVLFRIRWVCHENVVFGDFVFRNHFVKVFVFVDDVRESELGKVQSRRSSAIIRIVNN